MLQKVIIKAQLHVAPVQLRPIIYSQLENADALKNVWPAIVCVCVCVSVQPPSLPQHDVEQEEAILMGSSCSLPLKWLCCLTVGLR